MAVDYFVLSNFGIRYFIDDFTNTDTVPSSAGSAKEITSVLSCDIGGFSKDVKKYRALNSNGWESIASLGQSQDDATFDCVREGTGDPYTGSAGSSTYTKIKDWFMKATAQGGANSPKCIIEVIPRGSGQFEGTCYYCIPNNWKPGTKDTDSGQEYSFTVSPFGAPVPLAVSYDSGTDTFSFLKAAGSGVTGVSISGNSTVQMGSTITLTASVSPNTVAQTVTWAVLAGSGTATISSGGVLSPTSAGTVTVRATSTVDTTKYATKTVTITPGE